MHDDTLEHMEVGLVMVSKSAMPLGRGSRSSFKYILALHTFWLVNTMLHWQMICDQFLTLTNQILNFNPEPNTILNPYLQIYPKT